MLTIEQNVSANEKDEVADRNAEQPVAAEAVQRNSYDYSQCRSRPR